MDTTTTDLFAGSGREERLRAAWTEMLEDSDRIADEITVTMLTKDKGSGWSTPELRAVLRRSTREHVRRGLSRLAGLVDD